MYLPKLIEQGFSLKDVEEFTNLIKDTFSNRFQKNIRLQEHPNAAIQVRVDEVMHEYQQLLESCGPKIAQTVLIGSTRWLRNAADWTKTELSKTNSEHQVISKSDLQPVDDRKKVSSNSAQPNNLETFRTNTSVRQNYPTVSRPGFTAPPHLQTSFSGSAETQKNNSALGRIPRKRKQEAASSQSLLGDLVITQGNNKKPRKQFSQNMNRQDNPAQSRQPESQSQPVSLAPKPLVDQALENSPQSYFEKAFAALHPLSKELFGLLDSSHFGLNRAATKADLVELFKNEMLTQADTLELEPEQITTDFLQNQLTDLLLG